MPETITAARPQTVPIAARNGPSESESCDFVVSFKVDDMATGSLHIGQYNNTTPPPTFADLAHDQGGTIVSWAGILRVRFDQGLNQYVGTIQLLLGPFTGATIGQNMWAAYFDSATPSSGDAPAVTAGPWPLAA